MPEAKVPQIDVGGGLTIRSDGTYSSEYDLPTIYALLADELVRLDYRRGVIEEFRAARKEAEDA